MFDRAVEAVDAGLAPWVLIGCAEPNPTNFNEHLKPVCAELKHPHVEIQPSQSDFETAGTKLAEWPEQQKRRFRSSSWSIPMEFVASR
jgi:hypothetical protein